MEPSLESIKRNCSQARKAMERARKEHFALGAFNLDNQETLIAVVKAAVAKKAPAAKKPTANPPIVAHHPEMAPRPR